MSLPNFIDDLHRLALAAVVVVAVAFQGGCSFLLA